MKQYIFGERNGIYIIDLQQTLERIDTAYRFVRHTVENGGTVLFVGTKKQAQEPVEKQVAVVGRGPLALDREQGAQPESRRHRRDRTAAVGLERAAGDERVGALVQRLVDEELEQAFAGSKAPMLALGDAVKRGNDLLRRFERANRAPAQQEEESRLASQKK